MGLFKNLFGGSSKQDENFDSIDVNKEYDLVDYQKGEILKKIESKSYIETYEKFGLKGVHLHQQLKTHFKTIDILHDYFNNRPSQDVIDKSDWKSDDTNRYGFQNFDEILNNRSLKKSHDVTINLESFINTKNKLYGELIEMLNSSEFSSTDGKNNLRCYIGKEWNYTYVLLNPKKDKFSIMDFFSFLVDEDGKIFINKISNQVVGWNSVFFVSPLFLIHTNYSITEKETLIFNSDFNTQLITSGFGLKFNLRDRSITSEQLNGMTRWGSIYKSNYTEFFKSEYSDIKDVIETELNLLGQVLEIKKSSFELHENNDEFNNDIQLILRHLNQIINEIEIIFDDILPNTWNQSIGYLFPNFRVFNLYEHVEHKLFEFSVVKNLSEMMIECVKSKNKFLYKEIYLILEPHHIFDRTIEKKTLQELKDLNKGLLELNGNLIKLNKTLTRGFLMLSEQLSDIDNKLWYNNLLTTINTYQLYKISKK